MFIEVLILFLLYSLILDRCRASLHSHIHVLLATQPEAPKPISPSGSDIRVPLATQPKAPKLVSPIASQHLAVLYGLYQHGKFPQLFLRVG